MEQLILEHRLIDWSYHSVARCSALGQWGCVEDRRRRCTGSAISLRLYTVRRSFWFFVAGRSGSILFFADVFHPIDDFSIELFLNGEMSHSRGRCGTVPMFLTGREPDHVTGTDLLDGAAPALCQTGPGGHD